MISNQLINDCLDDIVPQIRIFLVNLEVKNKTQELYRYIGFTYPAIGEKVFCGGDYYEVYRISHNFISKNGETMKKPYIDCYCAKESDL